MWRSRIAARRARALGRCEFISRLLQAVRAAGGRRSPRVPSPTTRGSARGSASRAARRGARRGETAGADALEWLDEYFAEYIEDRRRDPRATFLTDMALAKYPTAPRRTSHRRADATFLFAPGRRQRLGCSRPR